MADCSLAERIAQFITDAASFGPVFECLRHADDEVASVKLHSALVCCLNGARGVRLIGCSMHLDVACVLHRARLLCWCP